MLKVVRILGGGDKILSLNRTKIKWKTEAEIDTEAGKRYEE